MVMLVWWILSLFDVCEFTWIPVMIDAAISLVALMAYSSNNDSTAITISQYVSSSVLIFAICKQFLSLYISNWWILVSPIWLIVAFFVPGGFTITNILFRNWGWMTLPTWVLIVGIVGDILGIAMYIMMIYEWRSEK